MAAQTKAVIFDLDGTAIPSRIDGLPSTRLQAALRANPIEYFCAATGRSWAHAAKPIHALGLQAPCVLSGGTQIIDPINEEILWQVVIPAASVDAIRGIGKDFGKNLAYVTDLRVTESVPSEDEPPKSPVNTIYMFDIQPSELERVLARLHAITNIHPALTRSWFRNGVTDLHITHVQATKEYAITELCRIIGVSRQETVGIGDGYNDLHLFNAVGTKVAMGNAETTLKQAADKVIGSIDEDGLAVFIEDLNRTTTDGLNRQN